MSLQPGDQAPDFTLRDQHGSPVTLSGLRGKTVVLSFYPWADTPGSTAQACGVRDHRADYAQAGVVVLGVTPDPVQRNAKFDNKYALGFPLLADKGSAVAETYGVWTDRSTNRRRHTLISNEPTTFVISPEGAVSAVFRNIKPGEHDTRVLDSLPGLELRPTSDEPADAAEIAEPEVPSDAPAERVEPVVPPDAPAEIAEPVVPSDAPAERVEPVVPSDAPAERVEPDFSMALVETLRASEGHDAAALASALRVLAGAVARLATATETQG